MFIIFVLLLIPEALKAVILLLIMKQVVINIPENKFSFFMKLMKSLNFVKLVESPQSLEEQLTTEQKEIWDNVKQGFEELKLVEEGKLKTRPLQELINEL